MNLISSFSSLGHTGRCIILTPSSFLLLSDRGLTYT